jgi:phosphoglycolate phosphatase
MEESAVRHDAMLQALNGATVVFDIDGTLVDTAPDLTNALNHVLTARGHAPVPSETVRSTAGLGARAMIEEGLRQTGASGNVDEMLADFLVYYEANIAVESRLFPRALAALEQLASAGARLAVCTNKREHLTLRLLAELGLEDRFHGIAGRDTFPVAKPDPAHLTGAIALAGGEPAKAVMVGDSEIDVRAAKAAGVPIVVVSFGYAPRQLHDLAPEGTIDHFAGLVPCAASLLRGIRPAASSARP